MSHFGPLIFFFSLSLSRFLWRPWFWISAVLEWAQKMCVLLPLHCGWCCTVLLLARRMDIL